MACDAKYCRGKAEINILGVRLCGDCWSRYCDDADFKAAIRAKSKEVLR